MDNSQVRWTWWFPSQLLPGSSHTHGHSHDRNLRLSSWPWYMGEPFSISLPNVGLLIGSIDFAPGYSSPFLSTLSWRWANPGMWAGERGCSRVFRRLGLWQGLRFLGRLNRLLETLELLVIMQVSSRFCRPCWALRSIHFRNCYPRRGWYVVVYAASCFAKDVWKDMILMDEVD